MKKKLLLLPIIGLLATTLSGCDRFFSSLFKGFEPKEVDPVYIDTWLKAAVNPVDSPNCSEYYYKDVNDEENSWCYDFNLEVRDMLKAVKYADATKISGEINDKTEKRIGYTIRYSGISQLNYCHIVVYVDGIVTTAAYGGGGKLSPGVKPQYFEYFIAPSDAEALVDSVIAKYSETMEGIRQERETCRESSSLDKFITSCEEHPYPPTAEYFETREDNPNAGNTYYVIDREYTILNQIKEVSLHPLQDDYKITLAPMITYCVDDGWAFELYCGYQEANYDIVSIKYYYEDTQYPTYYKRTFRYYFSIDPEKGEAIADTVRSLH